jgi:putative FmdB family regulatory protein
MPIYEYKCEKCDKTFELLQKINSEPLKKCIYCSGNVKKLISISSFQLKGTGWYETDYKKKNPNSKPDPKKSINLENKNNKTKNNKNASHK